MVAYGSIMSVRCQPQTQHKNTMTEHEKNVKNTQELFSSCLLRIILFKHKILILMFSISVSETGRWAELKHLIEIFRNILKYQILRIHKDVHKHLTVLTWELAGLSILNRTFFPNSCFSYSLFIRKKKISQLIYLYWLSRIIHTF